MMIFYTFVFDYFKYYYIMKELIQELLKNHFEYSEKVLDNYYRIADVRVEDGAEHRVKMNAVLNNENSMLQKVLSEKEFVDLKRELKRLDLNNLKMWVQEDINADMKQYIIAFIEEIELAPLFYPSVKLRGTEFKMFQHFFDCVSDENWEHVLGVSDLTLRYILQMWLLYPEFICDKYSCKEFLDILYYSNCKL